MCDIHGASVRTRERLFLPPHYSEGTLRLPNTVLILPCTPVVLAYHQHSFGRFIYLPALGEEDLNVTSPYVFYVNISQTFSPFPNKNRRVTHEKELTFTLAVHVGEHRLYLG